MPDRPTFRRRPRTSVAALLAGLLLAVGAAWRAAAAAPEAAAASPHPDFSGQWELDAKASEPVDEILRRQGMPWAERRLVRNIRVVQTISQDVDRVTIVGDAGWTRRTETLSTDGRAVERIGERTGKPVKVRTFWDPAGSLVTVLQGTTPDGTGMEVTVTRTLADDRNSYRQRIDMKLANGETLGAGRVMRRLAVTPGVAASAAAP